MTSNAGVELIKRQTRIGFLPTEDEAKTRKQGYETMKEKVMGEVRTLFRPEFLNRLDDIIVFHELSEAQLRHIVDFMIKDLQGRLSEHKLKLEITDNAKSWLAKIGFDPQYGARPLRRAIERYVENQLSTKVLSGESRKATLSSLT